MALTFVHARNLCMVDLAAPNGDSMNTREIHDRLAVLGYRHDVGTGGASDTLYDLLTDTLGAIVNGAPNYIELAKAALELDREETEEAPEAPGLADYRAAWSTAYVAPIAPTTLDEPSDDLADLDRLRHAQAVTAAADLITALWEAIGRADLDHLPQGEATVVDPQWGVIRLALIVMATAVRPVFAELAAKCRHITGSDAEMVDRCAAKANEVIAAYVTTADLPTAAELRVFKAALTKIDGGAA